MINLRLMYKEIEELENHTGVLQDIHRDMVLDDQDQQDIINITDEILELEIKQAEYQAIIDETDNNYQHREYERSVLFL